MGGNAVTEGKPDAATLDQIVGLVALWQNKETAKDLSTTGRNPDAERSALAQGEQLM